MADLYLKIMKSEEYEGKEQAERQVIAHEQEQAVHQERLNSQNQPVSATLPVTYLHPLSQPKTFSTYTPSSTKCQKCQNQHIGLNHRGEQQKSSILRWGKLEDQGSEDEEIEVELRKTKLQMKEIELEKKLRKKRRQV
ncbi:hypothetical protein CLAFUW4_11149 [Fulvia fulva]|nr:hypothetical protein CLAFUR4_11154 [Fulvia fulva]KAK4620635.1 hypothetical protein CLAFUR0_11159 [Fulvia fulva]WPV17369.1 hypothetical protein CLAFUW4_11149 [Fulvia fulva]WPV31875.1 hypothetical protein CLAFUW7_11145 [Fulvia fulva]